MGTVMCKWWENCAFEVRGLEIFPAPFVMGENAAKATKAPRFEPCAEISTRG